MVMRAVIGAVIGAAVCWPVGTLVAGAVWFNFYYRPPPWPEQTAVQGIITGGFVAFGFIAGAIGGCLRKPRKDGPHS